MEGLVVASGGRTAGRCWMASYRYAIAEQTLEAALELSKGTPAMIVVRNTLERCRSKGRRVPVKPPRGAPSGHPVEFTTIYKSVGTKPIRRHRFWIFLPVGLALIWVLASSMDSGRQNDWTPRGYKFPADPYNYRSYQSPTPPVWPPLPVDRRARSNSRSDGNRPAPLANPQRFRQP